MANVSRTLIRTALIGGAVVALTLGIANIPGVAQQGTYEWPLITGGNSATRYAPIDQINASNFNNLKVAWEWRGEVPPGVELGDINARGLPIYVDNLLYTTSGPRRTVVALDPVTGKTVWTFQEPETPRHAYSMRSNHGKGVAYTRINGRGVILVTTPGFFLHALDAKTGQVYWTHDVFAAVWGSTMVIDGKVYLGDEDGDVVVLQAGKTKKVLSEVNMGSAVYATMVPANGRLFVNNRNQLFALSIDGK